MFKANTDIASALGDFKLENSMFRYSSFVPRLYNYCKSLGFETGKIMPSRAFCSDENQGYPIILIAKHFGTFPFNHGQVGGVVPALVLVGTGGRITFGKVLLDEGLGRDDRGVD